MTRRKVFIFSVLFALIILFLLVILGKSQVNYSPISTYSPSITPGSPLMIIIDNSGSMGKCSKKEQGKCVEEIPNKIEIVKEAIRKRINQSDMASTKIGLVEFGNHRAYSTEKEICFAVKELAKLNINNNQELNQGLDKIQANDDGVTPISYAIKDVVAKLAQDKLLPARILVFTDGEPNCKDKTKEPWFCGIIGTYANNEPPVEIKVAIVGYKATGKDREFIDCAKKYPGVFSYLGSANSPSELDGKLNDAISSVSNPSTPTVATPKPVTSPSTPPTPSPSYCIKNPIALLLLGIAVLIFIFIFIRGQMNSVAIGALAAVITALATIVQALSC